VKLCVDLPQAVDLVLVHCTSAAFEVMLATTRRSYEPNSLYIVAEHSDPQNMVGFQHQLNLVFDGHRPSTSGAVAFTSHHFILGF